MCLYFLRILHTVQRLSLSGYVKTVFSATRNFTFNFSSEPTNVN